MPRAQRGFMEVFQSSGLGGKRTRPEAHLILDCSCSQEAWDLYFRMAFVVLYPLLWALYVSGYNIILFLHAGASARVILINRRSMRMMRMMMRRRRYPYPGTNIASRASRFTAICH